MKDKMPGLPAVIPPTPDDVLTAATTYVRDHATDSADASVLLRALGLSDG